MRDVIAKALCRSRYFETGEGTCALICLDQLGDARRDCRHAAEVHHKLAAQIEAALHEFQVKARRARAFKDWRNNGDSK